MDGDATRAAKDRGHPGPPHSGLDGSPDFAPALRTALVTRHATLRGLSDALSERGHLVSTTLLASWRSGSVVPGGSADLQSVVALESLLELTTGELTGRLDPDATQSTRGRRPGTVDDALPTPAAEQRRSVAEPADNISDSVQRARTALGFGRVVQSMLETRLELKVETDDSRTAWWVTQRSEWTSPTGGVDCVPLVVVTPTPVSGRVRVEAIEGCRLGPTYVDRAEGVFATSLVLPAPLRAGDTVSTVHRTHLPDDIAPTGADESWTLHDEDGVGVVRFVRQRTGLDGLQPRPESTKEIQ